MHSDLFNLKQTINCNETYFLKSIFIYLFVNGHATNLKLNKKAINVKIWKATNNISILLKRCISQRRNYVHYL